MKRGINREQGAVLVVALIMLAMITFLVVAFVGFARFERASVTASMRRTQAEFVAGDSLTMAQRQAISGLTNTVPHGLLVSKRSGGGFGIGVSRWHRGWHPRNGIDLS